MKGEWIREPARVEDSTVVIFIHGVLSDGDSCWKHNNGSFWPFFIKEEEKLSEFSIYNFTYQTGFFSGDYNLDDVSSSFWEHLKLDRIIYAPNIIIVAHSMGGIVARKMLVDRKLHFIRSDTRIGLFLVASPSLGSDYANWISPIAKMFGHSQADALRFCEKNQWLNNLNREFRDLIFIDRMNISGRELTEDTFIYLKTRFWLRRVVSGVSGAIIFGDPYKVPKSDHFSIAKPDSRQAVQHRLLCDFAAEFARSGPRFDKIERDGKSISTWVNDCRIKVIFGRIEQIPLIQERAIVLPCNEYFDDECIHDNKSALGAFMENHFRDNIQKIKSEIEIERKTQLGAGRLIEKSKGHVASSFGIGRCLLLNDRTKHPSPIALVSTATQRAGEGLSSRISYLFAAMEGLFETLADARISRLAMPLMGSGHGQIDRSLAFVGLVLAIAEAARHGMGGQRPRRVTIVVFQKDENSDPEISLGLVQRALALVGASA